MPLRSRARIGLAVVAGIVLGAVLIWFSLRLGLWDALGTAVQAIQRALHQRLAGAMRAVQENRSFALWNLVVLGFLYGVFHAVGPGHGKFVISTYLATTESGVRRGVLLTLVSSLAQGLTAIAIVEVTVRVLGLALRDARTGASVIETASYMLLALVGAGLAVAALHRSWRRMNGRSDTGAVHRHRGDEAHSHDDHVHGPDATVLAAPMTSSQALAIICSIGLRPCSGSVLVLLFAKILGLNAAGIGAVLAISAGTALTVSVLAVMAVHARRMALRLSRRGGVSRDGLATGLDLVAAAGGLVIVMIGISLFVASLQQIHHPLL